FLKFLFRFAGLLRYRSGESIRNPSTPSCTEPTRNRLSCCVKIAPMRDRSPSESTLRHVRISSEERYSPPLLMPIKQDFAEQAGGSDAIAGKPLETSRHPAPGRSRNTPR